MKASFLCIYMFEEKINYESEFEEKLLKCMQDNYGIKNNILEYFIIRYMFVNNIDEFSKINNDNFTTFILEENNIPLNIIYKNSRIDLFSSLCSVKNIVENWFFEIEKKNICSKMEYTFIENTYKSILKDSISENSKFKKEKFYNDCILYSCLKELNKQFNVSLDGFNKIEDLLYTNFNELSRYREEKLEILLKAQESFNANPLSLITEKDLEDYIKKNLHLIEKDLKFVSTQYKIKDAIIDILAEDVDKNKVIIELKIKRNDTRVVWQSIYYPKQFKKENKNDNVRMFIISPKLDYSILESLKELKNVEYYEYEINKFDKEIKELTIQKRDL